MASFFMSYEFDANVRGFNGTLTGYKIYSIGYYEEVERLINDAMKVLKNDGRSAVVTFERFEDSSENLSRVVRDWDGKIRYITWNRNGVKEEGMELNKKNIKKIILEAINLYREKEAVA